MPRVLRHLFPAAVARRGFLARICHFAGASLLPANFPETLNARLDFYFHPHYPEQTPVDAALQQISPDMDKFETERLHSKLAPVLQSWSKSLLQSPSGAIEVEHALSGIFEGFDWQAEESGLVRRSSIGLAVQTIRFSQKAVTPESFLTEMRASLGRFSKILTADFQVVEINGSPEALQTRVRYELVGTGPGFFREQRLGHWIIQWNGQQITNWQAENEIRSTSKQPIFNDASQTAFGANSSYASQMSHGADYWRTVLDGACGIDIYGHNGVSAGDIDGDGRDDIYVCQPAGLPNRLYQNLGDGIFEDITESSGVGVFENTACALFGDLTNNGRQDLIVVRANGPLLFLNEGGGKFRLKPDAFHFAAPPLGTFTGAALADYNRDGHLDIYFCLYVYYQGADQYRYPTPYFDAENGPPNFLMRNDGHGIFHDVTAETGLNVNNSRYSFCCGWSDYNGDGWPDLFVVNDFGRKNLYRNNGNGTFTDVASEAGLEDVGAGMSVCWLHSSNGKAEDLYCGNMWTAAGERIAHDKAFQTNASEPLLAMYRKHTMGNSFFRNTGSGFRNVTESSRTGVGRWAWSCDSWDFDHDGLPDLYITNGMISGLVREDLNSFFWRQVVANSPKSAQSELDYEIGWNAINEMIRCDHSWSGYERNVLYSNNGDGTFSDVSGAIGLDFREDGRSFALADFDSDGRLEVLLKNRNSPQLRLLKNTAAVLPDSISFRLQGIKGNRDAIGASVTIFTSTGKQTRSLQAGSGFLSQHTKELFFGLGSSEGDISATVAWPSGSVQSLHDLPVNHRVWVTEGLQPSRLEAFNASNPHKISIELPDAEQLPEVIETWLLVPILAPQIPALINRRDKPTLLRFCTASSRANYADHPHFNPLDIIADYPDNQQAASIYSLLFRYLFDRHRDLPLPTTFLIDEQRQIVKIYQGDVSLSIVERDVTDIPRSRQARLSKSLPFDGLSNEFAFGRNYLSLGSIFFQRGFVDSAGEFFQCALLDNPNSSEAYYGVGSVCLKQQQLDKARISFENAVKSTAAYPDTVPNAWNNLGLISTRQADFPQAAEYFKQAISLNPNSIVALVNLGNTYRQQKRWEEARTTLLRAVSLKAQDPEANYSLGMVYAQMDDSASADEYLHAALRARPVYPEALNNLGILYLRTHRRDEAVATFEKCIYVAPTFDQSYLNLSRVFAIEGQTNRAREVLRALLAQHPDHLAAKRALDQLP